MYVDNILPYGTMDMMRQVFYFERVLKSTKSMFWTPGLPEGILSNRFSTFRKHF